MPNLRTQDLDRMRIPRRTAEDMYPLVRRDDLGGRLVCLSYSLCRMIVHPESIRAV